MLEEKEADLLTAGEEFIVHQCCTTAVRPHGLSAVIAKRWPDADAYARRRAIGSRNLAVPEDRPAPGSIQVIGERRVICAYGQVEMGAPGRFNTRGLPDSAADRERYFAQCLDAIAALKPTSLAMPHGIGCGLARGNWSRYKRMLIEFCEKNPTTRVVLYHHDA